jgi:hypothetical protein
MFVYWLILWPCLVCLFSFCSLGLCLFIGFLHIVLFCLFVNPFHGFGSHLFVGLFVALVLHIFYSFSLLGFLFICWSYCGLVLHAFFGPFVALIHVCLSIGPICYFVLLLFIGLVCGFGSTLCVGFICDLGSCLFVSPFHDLGSYSFIGLIHGLTCSPIVSYSFVNCFLKGLCYGWVNRDFKEMMFPIGSIGNAMCRFCFCF